MMRTSLGARVVVAAVALALLSTCYRAQAQVMIPLDLNPPVRWLDAPPPAQTWLHDAPFVQPPTNAKTTSTAYPVAAAPRSDRLVPTPGWSHKRRPFSVLVPGRKGPCPAQAGC